MKKSYNSTDIHQKQAQELSKKLYRSVNDQSKRLDDARSCARNIKDLFSPSLHILRRKLCDYCERLIFSEPTQYGKKVKELLWRKGFYDVVTTVKRLKRKEYSQEEVASLLSHINSGIGFYHHFLSRLQNEFDVDLRLITDFALTPAGNNKKGELTTEMSEFINHCIYQTMIYLGDLNRYRLEINPNLEPVLAVRYYLQAIAFKPDCGMPHNQMGTVAMNQNRFLDAVYHYMRCLSSTISFEGTTNNLTSLFDKNSRFLEQLPKQNGNIENNLLDKSDQVKHFLARFLLLIDIWYFNKKVPKVYYLCHQTFKELESCLAYLKPNNSDSGDTPLDSESSETGSSAGPSYLTNTMLFKIVVICLLCITKLQTANAPDISIVVAFTLAVYSQLLQNITNHIQQSVLNYPLPEAEVSSKKKRKKSKLRRRKIVKVESEESDVSEDDCLYSGSSSDSSFASDAEDVLATSSDEEVEDDSSKNLGGKPQCQQINGVATKSVTIQCSKDTQSESDEIISKVKRMDVNDMLEIISEEGSLQGIKILNDWLITDAEVLKSCGSTTKSLFRQISFLLNLINIKLKSPKITGVNFNIQEVLANESKIPLPEDVTLRGVEILKASQNPLDWNYKHKNTMNLKEETIVRIAKFLNFGKALVNIEEVGITFEKKKFYCKFVEEEESENKLSNNLIEELDIQEADGEAIVNNKEDREPESKGLMKMKHMGQLWLAAEVRALESRVKGKTSLSPYLVLDAEALIQYSFMAKHLVHSRKFIVVVPSAVVSALDDLKREKLEARDAIRWLEAQFHRGNRFFRAQRPHERAAIPFIKYPKKKDKEMFIYINIIECCYYLAQQQKDASNLVTLLIGSQNILTNGENKEFSYLGLAQSAGITIESITQFYGKWKKTTVKGKR